MVAKPLIDYLLKNDFRIKIACNTCTNAQKILKDHPNGEIVYWDANDTEALKPMVEEAGLVVSLLPYKFHVSVAEICIMYKKHMVTTSYVRPEMSKLNKEAEEAGIIILNEAGLDPGIDHMSAMKIIDGVKNRGGTIEKFWSVCGALPAPECADNPMGYKFSWSPDGVLLASLNDATYLDNGEIIKIKGPDLFKKPFSYETEDTGLLEIYPNRDSISYIDIYGLQGIKTMFRGTFRHRGWCETLDAMKSLGLLDQSEKDLSGKTYAAMMKEKTKAGRNDIKDQTAAHLGLGTDSAAIRSFEWLGLFSDKKIPAFLHSSFDVISDLMKSKMMLRDNERDMTVLSHIFLASYNDGSSEVISSRMTDYGSPMGDTSIARTVALPAAVAVELIMNGKIGLKGVYRPVRKEIYMPVLDKLAGMGIKTEEKSGLPESELIF